MTKILCRCHGNICRSPMAEFVMKDLVSKAGKDKDFYIESAATSTEEIGNDMHYGTKTKLRQQNIPFTRRHARQITVQDYDKFDYLIAMDRNNLFYMDRFYPTDPDNKIHLLKEFAGKSGDIADPWYTGNFDDTWDDILEGCTALLSHLT